MRKLKLSEQILIRLPKSLFERVEVIANQNHWSLSKTVRKILQGVLEDTL